jgi:predicted nucleic acid-binding protein
MAQKLPVSVTPFNQAEVAHAFYNQAFRSKISVAEARLAWTHFADDSRRGVWTLVELPGTLWETAIELGRRFGPTLGVRTLDSLHVACALELKADKFWTFDERQEKLAEAIGLDTGI